MKGRWLVLCSSVALLMLLCSGCGSLNIRLQRDPAWHTTNFQVHLVPLREQKEEIKDINKYWSDRLANVNPAGKEAIVCLFTSGGADEILVKSSGEQNKSRLTSAWGVQVISDFPSQIEHAPESDPRSTTVSMQKSSYGKFTRTIVILINAQKQVTEVTKPKPKK